MSYKKSPFQNAPKKHANKTRFNHSHEHKSPLLPGYVTPCMRPIETLPGDEITISSEVMFKFSPLYFPIMHRLTMRLDTYYVPLRILWPKDFGTTNGWVEWLTKNEEVEPPLVDAYMAFNNLAVNVQVLAYFGIPLLPSDGGVLRNDIIEKLNAFQLSSYLMIYDWYERVPQVEDERWFPLSGGDNTASFETAFGVGAGFAFPLLSAKWEKDMFTSATPTPQVGDAIQIPLVIEGVQGPRQWLEMSDDTPPVAGVLVTDASGNTTRGTDVYLDIQATSATIKQLREAEVLQTFYERIMKIGDRYNDFIEGLWGTTPQPGLIDIPVLLGSKFGRVQISDVMTTATNDFEGGDGPAKSKTGDYTGQANLYASGGDTIRYRCNEHGFIITLIQVNANTSYGQGIDRQWRRTVQTDYALDMFASIGDQEILKEEVLYTNLIADAEENTKTFGYIDRFAEYKWQNNIHVASMNWNAGLSQHLGRWWSPTTANIMDAIEITAQFTNSAPFGTGIDQGGHRLVDVFRTLPSGNDSLQYPTEPVIYSWIFHSIFIERALPLYSTPKL